jgi:hypothetical protein
MMDYYKKKENNVSFTAEEKDDYYICFFGTDRGSKVLSFEIDEIKDKKSFV